MTPSDPKGAPVSATELDVLKELWEERRGTVRQILERLDRRGKGWAYNTVQTLLNRLCAKGYVEAQRGRVVEYSVVATREDLVRQQLDGIAETICDGEATPLVLSLFEGQRFSKDEIAEFRRLLDQLESGKSGKGGGRGR